MNLRAKLLLLLLSVSVLPLVIAGLAGLDAMRDLGDELSDETADALLADANRRLGDLAVEYGDVLALSLEQVDAAVRVQQVVASAALSQPPVAGMDPIYATDFDNPNTAPGNLVTPPQYDCRLRDGSTVPCPVSFEVQAIVLPPGMNREDGNADARRLQRLTPFYRELMSDPGRPALRLFTAAASGVHSTYPGHGGMPEGFDPRMRPWYTQAVRWTGIVHTPPMVDASTGRYMIASAAKIVDASGRVLGVTGADVALTDILHGLQLPEAWRTDATVRVVALPGIGGGDELLLIASGDMVDGSSDWSEPLEPDFLTGDSTSFRKLALGVKEGRAGVVDLEQGGRDAMVAFAPIGQFGASVLIEVPHDVIAAPAMQKRSVILGRTQDHLMLSSVIAAAVMVIVFLVALRSSRTVTRPIRQLAAATERVSKGDLDVSVPVRSSDEIGQLARDFNAMVPHLKERMTLRQSLEVAREIQQCLLPAAAPTLSGWDITGRSMYCDETGGDYFDYIEQEGNAERLRVVLGDVTGHGIASALMMATARSLLRGGAKCPGSPAERLGDINASIVKDTPLGWFMTFFCLEVSADSGTLRWISAGHDPAVMVAPGGEMTLLEGTDVPLGIDESWQFSEQEGAEAPEGAIIVIGTDGIWEARNTEGDMYGRERFIEVIQDTLGGTAEQTIDAILESVMAFCDGAPQLDDITLVAAKRSGA